MNLKQLFNSFRYALKGFKYVFRHEQNFQIQVLGSLVVLIIIFALKVDLLRAALLILLCTGVLILELLNTAAERVTDILKPRLHHYVEMIKDIMAAAVLVSSVGSVVVGLLILWPYLIKFVNSPVIQLQ